MKVLIVQHDQTLARLWGRHLKSRGAEVRVASGQEAATRVMLEEQIDVIVLDLMLAEGSALAVADFASYRQPHCRVVFVTDTAVFSDGLDLPPLRQRLRLSAKRHRPGRSCGHGRALRGALRPVTWLRPRPDARAGAAHQGQASVPPARCGAD